MSRTPWSLVRRHLLAHKLRTGLTIASVAAAVFLFCFLASVVDALRQAVVHAASDRVMVQSRVSLFVDMPQEYQQKIARVPGVAYVTPFAWFGGHYKDSRMQFGQFGVDHGVFFEQYAQDFEIVEGPGGTTGPAARSAARTAFQADRRGAIIGTELARLWKVGDTVPLQATIYARPDGAAWEFVIVGIYRPLRANLDANTMFFRFDYLDETLRPSQGPVGIGCFAVNLVPGHAPENVIPAIDEQFARGPQATMTSTEAAFQAGFVSMFGNLPLLFRTIGGAVLCAVLLSVINTMLMAARQRVPETGILQALGFTRARQGWLFLLEALLICASGGVLGIVLALLSAAGISRAFGSFLAAFTVTPPVALAGLGIAVAMGLIAGSVPGPFIIPRSPTTALRSAR